ncbi:uncharacterized protein LOC142098422 [Mixophyes fleayi]|uniref:uncharacterized protein LOC142098422 n=1 Tax=Mixophyes fleayi TaxID=3061075 RepID=UPI003F4D7823
MEKLTLFGAETMIRKRIKNMGQSAEGRADHESGNKSEDSDSELSILLSDAAEERSDHESGAASEKIPLIPSAEINNLDRGSEDEPEDFASGKPLMPSESAEGRADHESGNTSEDSDSELSILLSDAAEERSDHESGAASEKILIPPEAEERKSSSEPWDAPTDCVTELSPLPSDNWNCNMLVENAYWWYKQCCIITHSIHKCEWIEDLLQSNSFSEFIKDGKISKFEICGGPTYTKNVFPSSCVIFCFENNVWGSALLDEVKMLASYYEMKNVIVLLGGGSSDHSLSDQNMTMTSWCKEQKYKCSFKILQLTDSEITWYRDHLNSCEKKVEEIRILLGGLSYSMMYYIPSSPNHTVGIFSRSPESEYKWLIVQLNSSSFQSVVQDVRACYISNNRFWQFREDVSQCTFGILYHTKNRGRINITDVPDSLYDAELEYMSEELGNSKVIVVVDDLENSSDKEKKRILELQPSIKTNAQDMFLFTSEENIFLEKLVNIKKLIIKDPAQQE